MSAVVEVDGEVRPGRRFGYATVGEWVLLATGISDRAARIYCLLRMHCQGDSEKSFPSQKTLAHMLGIKKTDPIGAAIAELVRLGAVDVVAEPCERGRRNIYYVHEAPPIGYDGGPRGRTDYYQKHTLDSGVTPKTGVTPNPGDTPESEGGVTPETGVRGHPRNRGQKYYKGKQHKETSKDTDADASADASPADDGQGTLFASWRGLFPDTPANDPASTDASADKPDPNAGSPPDAPTRASHQNSAGADRVTAQTVTAAWVDAYRGARGDVRPTRGQIGQASRAAKECLAAGNDPTRVLAAAEAAGRAGYPTIERQLAMMTAPQGGGRHAPPYRDADIPDDAYAEAIR